MVHASKLAESAALAQADQRVFLRDVDWWRYEAMLAVRGDNPVPRMNYLEGVLELMSPSSVHEVWKTMIARLVEAYAEETDLPLNGFGSLTMKRPERKRGAEPDECYVLGPLRDGIVDLAIEVVKTSGGLDKLEIYRGLGVGEVWIYEDEAFTIHVLDGDQYAPSPRSRLLPGLDLELLASFVTRTDQTRAVRAFRAALRP